MNNLCKNCDTETTDLYCPHCGQPTKTKRIDWSIFSQEFIYNNFTLHKGLLFTIKSLIINPKRVIEDYLYGKRVKYTGAVLFYLFYFILAALFQLIKVQLGIQQENVYAESDYKNIDISNWVKSLRILTIVLSSFSTFIIYRNKKYNLSEHVVINFYIWPICLFLAYMIRVVTFYKLETSEPYIFNVLLIIYYIRTFYDKRIRIIDCFKGILCFMLFQITVSGLEQLIVIIYNLNLFK
jgi:hypothetical protein